MVRTNGNALGYNYNWGYDANGNPVLYGMSLSKYLDSKNTMPVADTDWFDEITRTGVIQQYNLSVSNGSEKGSSFFSLGYYKNLGVIKDTDFDRFSARMNSDYKLIDDILTIGQHFTLNRTSEVQAPGGIIETALDIPSAIPVYASDGSWGGPVADGRTVVILAPYSNTTKTTDTLTWRMFGDAYVNLSSSKDSMFVLLLVWTTQISKPVTSPILIRKEHRPTTARVQWKPNRNTGPNGCGMPLPLTSGNRQTSWRRYGRYGAEPGRRQSFLRL